MSAIIFVALAIGWAAYLIPQALKRHDDQAQRRPVDTFSDKVRIVGRSAHRAAQPAPEPAPEASAPAKTTPAPQQRPAVRHLVTRPAARSAARRRRRVLAVLLLALAAVSATSYLAYTPWWSTAIPGGLIVAFLIIARLSVRAQQARRAAAPADERAARPAARPAISATPAAEAAEPGGEADLAGEDTVAISRDELAEQVAAPAMEDGGLWDPLPVTLPTYVSKAQAHRTVRTIDVTGMTSSGHDEGDSALAREAEAAAEATGSGAAESDAEGVQRRAAGA